MATNSPFDTEVVRDLAKLLAETDLTEIEVEKGDLRIYVARQITAHVAVAAPQAAPLAVAPATTVSAQPAATKGAEEHPGAVRSPMVGTAYLRPSPEAKPFVEIGSSVKVGQQIMLIEAMKTFNEIIAQHAGTVTQIFVDDSQPVEFGQPLMIIE